MLLAPPLPVLLGLEASINFSSAPSSPDPEFIGLPCAYPPGKVSSVRAKTGIVTAQLAAGTTASGRVRAKEWNEEAVPDLDTAPSDRQISQRKM